MMGRDPVLEPKYDQNGRLTFEGASYEPELGDRILSAAPFAAAGTAIVAVGAIVFAALT